MKLSVRLITYNHAPFIAQAIEGVLMQQTNFDFEIVIGEDGSNDGTREIVQQYQAKYPDKIRLLLNDRKNVIYIDGKPTGRWNFMNTLRQCRGQYIALLDGDDYWTSPHKLQKQVDLLDQNPDCAFCFHDVETLLDDGTRTPGYELIHVRKPWYELRGIFSGEFYPPTCSVVYRNGLFKDFPDWFTKVPFADFPLHVLNGERGKIGFLNESLGVYRLHPGGIWSQGQRKTEWSEEVWRVRQKADVEFIALMDVYLNRRYHDCMAYRIADGSFDLVRYYRQKQDWPNMRKFLLLGFRARPRIYLSTASFLFRSFAVAFCPVGYKFFRKIKDLGGKRSD